MVVPSFETVYLITCQGSDATLFESPENQANNLNKVCATVACSKQRRGMKNGMEMNNRQKSDLNTQDCFNCLT